MNNLVERERTFVVAGSRLTAPAAPPGLSIVATPIGNLADMTLRGLSTLAGADVILCEDTRISRRLVTHYGISVPLQSYHEHNAAKMRPRVLERLAAGDAVALISDAGMPLISDPGYKLVREAQEQGSAVTVIPGASSVPTALAASGLPTDRFVFLGFPPAKASALRPFLAEFARAPATLVMFESAKRAAATLATACAVLGPEREAVLARELTKLHEEVVRLSLAQLAERFKATPPRGEVVLLIGPPADAGDTDDRDADALLRAALERLPPSKAAAEVAQLTGLARRELFARALDLAKAPDAGDGDSDEAGGETP